MKKYLAMTAATLFLLAAPGAAFAQDSNGGNNGGSNNGGSNNGGNNAGGADNSNNGNAGGDNNNTQGTSDSSQCSDETATSSYGSFSSKCRGQIDAWAASQKGNSATYDGDLAEGAVLPDTVQVIEVPAYRNYGYAMVNNKRVLVDRNTHKVIRVY